MKNLLTNNNSDDEFSSTTFSKTIIKRRRKKFRMIKCDKIKIKTNDNEILAIMNSKAKINLISNVLAKKLKLVSFNVSFCEIMTFDNNQLKFYDVYFVRLKVSNENDVNRFFNENFLEVNLFWSISLNLSWFKLSEIEMNWIEHKIRSWQLSTQNLLLITNRIEKIESKELVNDVIDDKNEIFVMFVRAFHDEKTNLNEIHIERRTQIDSILLKIKEKFDIKIIIFEILKKFAEITDEKKTYELFAHESDDHSIDLKSNKKSLYESIYSLSENELTILKAYLNKHLKNDFIKSFIFAVEVFILFVKKKKESLRLCVNYRDLNLLTIKNRYSLSLIDESLDRLNKTCIYTNLDMIATYNKLRIKKDDEWKTTFRTRYEHFEYIVLFFDLINAFATFQSFVNKILTKRLDLCVIVYLNDIVIYSMNREQHIENVKWILQRLKKNKLFINNEKCKWFTNSIDFLSFVVFSKNVQMQKNKIKTIQKWSASRNVSEIQNFLDLCNFYRRFIQNFNKLTLSLIFMLKESTELHKKNIKRKRFASRSRNKERVSNDFLISEVYEFFKHLRKTFLTTSILRHFDSIRFIRVKIDVSNKAIDDIFCQSNNEDHWHFVVYFSRKMISIECHYEIHDKELLTIVFAFKQWRHYFEKVRKQVLVLTNHRNFSRFMSITKLTSRQVRWVQKLSRYNFVIDYRFDSKNSANDLSRRFNHMKINESEIESNRQILTQLRKSLQTNSIEFRACVDAIQATMQKSSQMRIANSNFNQRMTCEIDDLVLSHTFDCVSDVIVDEWKIFMLSSATIFESIFAMIARKHIHKHDAAYEFDETIDTIVDRIRSLLTEDSCATQVRQKLATFDTSFRHWHDENEVLWHESCLYVLSSLRDDVICANHDNSLIEHFDVKRILKLIRRKYYWSNQERNDQKDIEHDLNMRAQIKEYCETCVICKRNKVSRHKSYEKLFSLSISKFKWVDITMNFVTNLFENKAWNEVIHDSILVVSVMNKLTKMTYYIFVTKTVIAEDLVEILIREIIRLHDLSSSITTNRDFIFTFKYHDSLCYALKIKLKLFTAYHSQIDDQTERQNSIMKQYLKAFVNFEQNNWIELLFMTEFAYNNNKHASTQMSSFEAMQKYTSRMSFENSANFKVKSKFVNEHVKYLTKLLNVLKINLTHAQKQQIKYKNAWTKTTMHFDVRNYVNLNDKNIRIKRNKKLKWKFFEFFKILETIEDQTYRIDISKRWRIHNVFHVSFLERIKVKRKKKVSLKFTYQFENIDIDENEITKKIYDVEVIENNKIFKENQISKKSYSESDLYYLIRWKNYEKRIWKSVSMIKHLRDMLRKFHTKNSKKNDVNKLTNKRRVRRQVNAIFLLKQLIRKQNH